MYLASKQYVKITAPMGPPGNVHFRGTGFGPLLEALLLPSNRGGGRGGMDGGCEVTFG